VSPAEAIEYVAGYTLVADLLRPAREPVPSERARTRFPSVVLRRAVRRPPDALDPDDIRIRVGIESSPGRLATTFGCGRRHRWSPT
jgi:hypothetical protein